MGFHALGLGFISKKTIENGNGIKMWAGQPLRWWDLCSMGQWDLVKIWAGKWEYDPPPPLQDPLLSKGQIRPTFFIFCVYKHVQSISHSTQQQKRNP
jgi:hypothetical protein